MPLMMPDAMTLSYFADAITPLDVTPQNIRYAPCHCRARAALRFAVAAFRATFYARRRYAQRAMPLSYAISAAMLMFTIVMRAMPARYVAPYAAEARCLQICAHARADAPSADCHTLVSSAMPRASYLMHTLLLATLLSIFRHAAADYLRWLRH